MLVTKLRRRQKEYLNFVPQDLCYYVSKDCRYNLAKACEHAIKVALDNGDIQATRAYPSTILARMLGVHRTITSRWLSGKDAIQGCNEYIEKLITIGLQICPERTIDIIEQDMEVYRSLWMGLSENYYGRV